MVWAILILLGVPLWFCVVGITVTVLKNRSLRKRHGNIPARVKRPGKTRWTRGHAIWVSDVFAWRRSPAAWSEDLVHVTRREAAKPRATRSGTSSATSATTCRSRRSRSADGEPLEVAAEPTSAPRSSGPSWSTRSPGTRRAVHSRSTYPRSYATRKESTMSTLTLHE